MKIKKSITITYYSAHFSISPRLAKLNQTKVSQYQLEIGFYT